MATVLGSADRDVSVITGNSIGQHSRVNIAGVKATNPSEGHHRKQGQRQAQDEAGSGPGRGRHLRRTSQFIFSVLPTALFPPCGPSDERWGFSGPGKHESRFPCH